MRESVRRPVRRLLVLPYLLALSAASPSCVRPRINASALPDSTWARGPHCWAEASEVSQFEIRRAAFGSAPSLQDVATLVVVTTEGSPGASPIRAVSVIVRHGQSGWQADADSAGVARLNSLPAARVDIEIRAIGYEWSFRRITLRGGVTDTALVRLRAQLCT
jgi:hypothetical protein